MRKLLLSLILLVANYSFAQNDTGYKYVIVPAKFDFTETENLFNINELAKFLMEKRGFEVYFSNEIKPTGLKLDECSVLYLNIEKLKSMLNTKLQLTLKECTDRVVAQSTGMSREKKHHAAYNLAIREANDSLVIPKRELGVVLEQPKSGPQPTTEQPVEKVEGYLYAIKSAQGYVLVDHQDKEVYKLFKTSKADQFILSSDTINGALYKVNNTWTLEYLKDEQVHTETLKIRF